MEMYCDDVIRLYNNFPAWQKLGRIIAQDQFVRAEKREAALLKDLPDVRFETNSELRSPKRQHISRCLAFVIIRLTGVMRYIL
jgi:hypothetical protein